MSDAPRLQRLTLPLTPKIARSLRVGDVVTLDGTVVGTAGYPTHARLHECVTHRRPVPIAMRGGSLFHMGSLCEKTGDGWSVVYMNPTTSTRFNAYLPGIVSGLGLTALAGKGGVDAATVAAMRQAGCVYFSVVGGASALLSGGVTRRPETAWDDLIEQFRLSRFQLDGFGPVSVAIDAHGNSLYESLKTRAEDRLPDILARLAQRRGEP